MFSCRALHPILMVVLGFSVACGSSGVTVPDSAGTASSACEAVGTTLCHQTYACYSASEIAGLEYPPTEAECVSMENAHCSDDPPAPGFCKGQPQTSTANANACATEITDMTCAQFRQPSSGTCKTDLCVPPP